MTFDASATRRFISITATTGTALEGLKVARQIAVWFHRTFGDRAFRAGLFQPPRPPLIPIAPLRDELEQLRVEQIATLSAADAARRAAAQAGEARRTIVETQRTLRETDAQ
jgi:type I restriction enzyme R subunit